MHPEITDAITGETTGPKEARAQSIRETAMAAYRVIEGGNEGVAWRRRGVTKAESSPPDNEVKADTRGKALAAITAAEEKPQG